MKSMNTVILALSWLFLSSCGNYLDKNGGSEAIDSDVEEKLTADFSTVRDFVFIARCTSCHQQYRNYQGVLRELSAIQNAVDANRMPKTGGPLTDQQKSILFAWIAIGAPEKAGASDSPLEPAPLEPHWKSISENIFFPKCLVCHNPQGQAKFLDLSSRQMIFNQRNRVFGAGAKLIDFDSPEQSYLIEILRDEEEPMPPTWSNISRLTQAEIKAISDWISLGLP